MRPPLYFDQWPKGGGSYCNVLQFDSLLGYLIEVIPVYRAHQFRGVGDLFDVSDQGLLLDGIHGLHLLHQRLTLDSTAQQQDQQSLHLVQAVLCRVSQSANIQDLLPAMPWYLHAVTGVGLGEAKGCT